LSPSRPLWVAQAEALLRVLAAALGVSYFAYDIGGCYFAYDIGGCGVRGFRPGAHTAFGVAC